LGKLWQAESSKAVAKVPERKDLVCVIEYPTRMNVLRHAAQIAAVEPQGGILRGRVSNRILINKGGCPSTKRAAKTLEVHLARISGVLGDQIWFRRAGRPKCR
jgi:hypothetical protein